MCLIQADHNDLDEIFSPTSVENFPKEEDQYEGKGEDYNKMAGVGIGPGASQAQYRKPCSNKFNSSQVDSSYINRMRKVDELKEEMVEPT